MAEMYALPEIDLTKALSVLGNLELALAWPEMEWHIEMPTLLSVGVLFLELTTRVVGYVYKTYLSKFEIEEAHFRRPMMPVNAAVWLGLKAQIGFQVMWDVAFGCWATCGTCWVPGVVCVGVRRGVRRTRGPSATGAAWSRCARGCAGLGREAREEFDFDKDVGYFDEAAIGGVLLWE